MAVVYSSVTGKIALIKKPETLHHVLGRRLPFQNICASSGLAFYRVGKLSLENDHRKKNLEQPNFSDFQRRDVKN